MHYLYREGVITIDFALPREQCDGHPVVIAVNKLTGVEFYGKVTFPKLPPFYTSDHVPNPAVSGFLPIIYDRLDQLCEAKGRRFDCFIPELQPEGRYIVSAEDVGLKR